MCLQRYGISRVATATPEVRKVQGLVCVFPVVRKHSLELDWGPANQVPHRVSWYCVPGHRCRMCVHELVLVIPPTPSLEKLVGFLRLGGIIPELLHGFGMFV
ncbi:hypothetical protein JTB14_000192 [Gonioctena quinquepunctata]|nr:hypothetical protein JTB14_000192 [Gonioctena quinquepunctata]